MTTLFANTVIEGSNSNSGSDLKSQLNNAGNIYGYIILYFILIGAIIAGIFLLRRFMTRRVGSLKSGSYLRIIDRAVISQDKQIVLIEISGKIIVAGITAQQIQTLHSLDKSDLTEFTNTDGDKSFGGIFNSAFNKLAGRSEENNKHE